LRTWTVVCSGKHPDHFGSAYHSYWSKTATAFEIPAVTAEAAAAVVRRAGLLVLYVTE
jgi:hypothetical protein